MSGRKRFRFECDCGWVSPDRRTPSAVADDLMAHGVLCDLMYRWIEGGGSVDVELPGFKRRGH